MSRSPGHRGSSRQSGARFSPYPMETLGAGATNHVRLSRDSSSSRRDILSSTKSLPSSFTLQQEFYNSPPNCDVNGATEGSRILHTNAAVRDQEELSSDQRAIVRDPTEHLVRVLRVVDGLSKRVQNMERLLEKISRGVDRIEALQNKPDSSEGHLDSAPAGPSTAIDGIRESLVDVSMPHQDFEEVSNSGGEEKVTKGVPTPNRRKIIQGLSKHKQKTISLLIKHYLLQPQATYTTLPQTISAYLDNNAACLGLDAYITDPTIRAIIDNFLPDQIRKVKSVLRKEVWQSIEHNIALQVFARRTLGSCRLPMLKMLKLTDDVLANLAFMRRIAVPLISIANASTNNAEFWESLEAELGNLYGKYGANRKSAAWLSWEKDTIMADSTQLDKFRALVSEVIHRSSRRVG